MEKGAPYMVLFSFHGFVLTIPSRMIDVSPVARNTEDMNKCVYMQETAILPVAPRASGGVDLHVLTAK
jgi:hypothetical protein